MAFEVLRPAQLEIGASAPPDILRWFGGTFVGPLVLGVGGYSVVVRRPVGDDTLGITGTLAGFLAGEYVLVHGVNQVPVWLRVTSPVVEGVLAAMLWYLARKVRGNVGLGLQMAALQKVLNVVAGMSNSQTEEGS